MILHSELLLPFLLGCLLLGAPAAYIAGRLWPRRRPAPIVALLALAGAWYGYAGWLRTGAPISFAVESLNLAVDGISVLLTGVILALASGAVLFSWADIAGQTGREKYYAMILALAGAIVGLGTATDLFNLWLWFEAMAVTSYLLVAFYREEGAALEAGVKYLVQSAAGSALVLLGIALVLAATGSITLTDLPAAAGTAPAALLLVAGALFVVGFGVKAALVPLHTWLPDAHAQAPTAISALLSGIVIEAGLVALLRVAAALAGITPGWGLLLLSAGALNMLAGNLLALQQTQIKRLLAYSSLTHVGFILLGIGLTIETGAAAGAQSGFFHLLNHGLMKALAFFAAGALLYQLRPSGSHRPLTRIDLIGAGWTSPLVGAAFTIALLSLGGIPPLAGFMSKWQILAAGVVSGRGLLIAFVIFAAANSLLSLGYYLPLITQLYRPAPATGRVNGRSLPLTMSLPLLLGLVALVVIGLWPTLVTGLSGAAGGDLWSTFTRALELWS